MKTRRPLEPGVEEIRALTEQVLVRVLEHTASLDEALASDTEVTPALMARVSKPPPEGPGELADLLETVLDGAVKSYQTAGPSYLAYIPGGGIFSSALAGFLGSVLNRYTGKVGPAPALVAMEESVLRWMCDLFELPMDSQALLTSGGSMANLIAITCARTRHATGKVDRATVYVGEHAHGSIPKAARIAGIARPHVRLVRSTSELRLDVAHLRQRIQEDVSDGLAPICVCAAAGTTNTGTIDDLEAAAWIAREAGVWFHVDGAYGGLFQLTGRGRARLAGIELADSITLDPHKSLFLPFGIGAIAVRSREALRTTFAEDADYMQDLALDTDLPELDALSPELTREFRGLRVWLPLHLHGVSAFREQLDEKLDLAEHAHTALAADPMLEVPRAPDLTVVVFRLAGQDDAAQLAFLDRINASQRVLLSSTRLEGVVFIRLAILSVRTHRDRIDEALDIIRTAARAHGPTRGGAA